MQDTLRLVTLVSAIYADTVKDLPRVYCSVCNEGAIKTLTLGTIKVVLTAFLGVLQVAASQTTRLVLTDVEVGVQRAGRGKQRVADEGRHGASFLIAGRWYSLVGPADVRTIL